MIISEYKLDFVVARLIERLEGTRRSFKSAGDQEMSAAFERIATEHLDAVIGEFREMGMADHPDAHAAFLRREVMDTFLPRYVPMASEANRAERRGFGLGPLSTPVGRIAIGFLAIFFCILLPKLKLLALFYPALPFLLISPFMPDVLRWFFMSKYRRSLRSVIDDMTTIQDRVEDYLPKEQYGVLDDTPVTTSGNDNREQV